MAITDTQQVLLTRPLAESTLLKQALSEQGVESVIFPTLKIISYTPSLPESYTKGYDYIVFISKNAVKYGHYILHDASQTVRPVLLAVGGGTAHALEEYGHQASYYPKDKPSSKALLQLPEVANIHHKKILIVRGVGGVEILKHGFEERGNTVEYLEVYERKVNEQATLYLDQVAALLDATPIIVITSIDIFEALVTLLGDKYRISLHSKFVVASKRIQTYLNSQGFFNIIIVSVHDKDIIKGVMKWLN